MYSLYSAIKSLLTQKASGRVGVTYISLSAIDYPYDVLSVTAYTSPMFLSEVLPNQQIWIGANDIISEGSYEWVSDGSPVIYSNWELSYDTLRNCAVMDPLDPDSPLEWKIKRCDRMRPFMCEYI